MSAITPTKEEVGGKENSLVENQILGESSTIDPSADFCHLHVHSHYSLLQALPKIPDLVKHAKKLNMRALALTDAGNMYGAIEFYKECKKKEIKPILGVDFFVATRTRLDREPGIDNKRTRLILLAKNLNGYKNLIKLVTTSNLDGFYYKPRIDRELIEKHKDGLIAIIPSFGGDLSILIKGKDTEKAAEIAAWYKSQFNDDVYLEITHHPEMEGHEDHMKKLVDFSCANSFPIVAAHDAYYLDPDDKRARETLVSIQNDYGGGSRTSDSSDWSFISQSKAAEIFANEPEALLNVSRIVDACNLDLPLGIWLFPHFEIKSGRTADEELREIVFDGMKRRNIEPTTEVLERVEYELGIIKTKGYAAYFLVVGDLLREAHDRHILTTIRGSVAGSMVTYLAHITNVNPMEYLLPFERFLNPERPSAPDIDMDFADNRRDEIIQYARDKYGHDKVAQIGTFGTMMARGAVRDVARALGFPYATGDRVSKMIPMGSQGFPMTIDKALEIKPELKAAYDGEDDIREIIDMAKKLEGCARHISVHAAGVVISPIPLNEIVPTQFDPKGEGKIITQYDMHYVDENSAGLLKFDFLGIRNLSILADAVRMVKEQLNVVVDIENVPVDDKKTFEMLARGETMGLFQLNGDGMTKFLVELKPSTIHDINAMVALYRPGPIEYIPKYIERKHNPKLVRYLDPRMEAIISRSYGVITYQDDVMMIAIKLAGYSWLEADVLRKAMGKKIPALMEEQKAKLKEGLLKNGMSEAKADELWSLIEPFAAYGFNKAHAASYGKVAYQTAYMKANFPSIYMSAALSAESGDAETVASYINESKRMGIPVLPPSINESFKGFTVVKVKEDEAIRFGLVTIKNFGEGIAETIITERTANGKFVSLEDLLKRVNDRNLNKKSLEALIKSGALDEFEQKDGSFIHMERGLMLANIDKILEFNKEMAHMPEAGDTLFGGMTDASVIATLKLADAPAATMDQKLIWEKELLGLFVSGHPLDKHASKFSNHHTTIATLKENAIKLFTAINLDELENGPAYDVEEKINPIGTEDITEIKVLEDLAKPFTEQEQKNARNKNAGKKIVSAKEKAKIKEERRKLKKERDRQHIIGGMIVEAKEIITKSGTRMAFITLTDNKDNMECVVFPRTYELNKDMFKADACIAIKGKLSYRNNEISMIVDKVKMLD